MSNIIVFGDSIAYGSLDKKGGWTDRVKCKLNEICLESNLEKFHLVYNLGIPGNTSEDLFGRIKKEYKQRKTKEDQNIVIIACGINDSKFIVAKNDNLIPKEIFRNNLNLILEELKEFDCKIIFLGISPVDEEINYKDDWTDGIIFRNSDIYEYDKIIQNFANEFNCDFIEIYNSLLNDNDFKKLYCLDGIHPSTLGHKKISEIVMNYLEKNDLST